MLATCSKTVIVSLSIAALVATLPGIAHAAPEVQRPAPAADGEAPAATEASVSEVPAADPNATGGEPPAVGEQPPAPDQPPPAYEPPPEAFPQQQPPPPAYVPPPRPYQTQPRVNPNRGMGLTIVGFSAWGVIYLGTVAFGTINIDAADNPDYYNSEEYNTDTGEWETISSDPGDRKNQKTYGQRMLIPVAGPFMAIPYADSATGSFATAMLGVVQLAALSLGIAGAVRLSKSRKEARFAMGVAPSRYGGMSTMRFRF